MFGHGGNAAEFHLGQRRAGIYGQVGFGKRAVEVVDSDALQRLTQSCGELAGALGVIEELTCEFEECRMGASQQLWNPNRIARWPQDVVARNVVWKSVWPAEKINARPNPSKNFRRAESGMNQNLIAGSDLPGGVSKVLHAEMDAGCLPYFCTTSGTVITLSRGSWRIQRAKRRKLASKVLTSSGEYFGGRPYIPQRSLG